MKKYPFLLLALAVFFPANARYIAPVNSHALAMWFSGGYSSFHDNRPQTTTIGGWGLDFGLGYEFGSDPEGFLLQTGFAMSPQNSTMKFDKYWREWRDMTDINGKPGQAEFVYNKVKQKDFYMHFNFDMLFGYKWENGVHFLCGPKVSFPLYGQGVTTANIFADGEYTGKVDANDNLQLKQTKAFENDTLIHRSNREMLVCNPYVGGVFEVGYDLLHNYTIKLKRLKKEHRNYYTSLRLSAFLEYGCYININSTTTDPQPLVVDHIAERNYYAPYVNDFLLNGQKAVQSVFIGAKVTFLIHAKEGHCMLCDTL